MTNFSRELEVRIKELKGDFVAITQWEAFCLQDGGGYCHDRLAALQEGYRSALRDLRASAAHADTGSLPSLLAIPTVPLTPAEMCMHRIWLGGPLPAMAAEALRQWQCALDASAGADYALALWVWDAHQLRDDPALLLFRSGRRVRLEHERGAVHAVGLAHERALDGQRAVVVGRRAPVHALV